MHRDQDESWAVPREGAHHAFPSMPEIWKEERSVGSEKEGGSVHVA